MNYNANDELKKLDEYYPYSDLKHPYKQHRETIITLLSTIESVWKNKTLDEQNFKILTEGLKNPWVIVFYHIVGKEINLMTGKVKGIEDLIFNGIVDKRWQTRFNTVVVMKGFKNKEIQSRIIEIALNDKSDKVREMALDVKTYY
jgi:hypothetical protein